MAERKNQSERIMNDLKEFFCKTLVFLEKGKAGLVHYSKILTLKSDASLLKGDKRVLLRRLGEEVYNAEKEGKVTLPESKSIIGRIDRIEKAIKEKVDEIETLEEGSSVTKPATKVAKTQTKKPTSKKPVKKKKIKREEEKTK